jgi:hypothetical protein
MMRTSFSENGNVANQGAAFNARSLPVGWASKKLIVKLGMTGAAVLNQHEGSTASIATAILPMSPSKYQQSI